jgi:hypothetical protein
MNGEKKTAKTSGMFCSRFSAVKKVAEILIQWRHHQLGIFPETNI